MVKPDFDLWTGTDPIFRVVNRLCILCLISSRVGSGRVMVGFFLLFTPSGGVDCCLSTFCVDVTC
ncbi:hypothetical protein Hanom_Chr16g01473731 [Helianthus anomalus]